MDLGIVAQRLIVPHALCGGLDRLFIQDPPLVERDLGVKAVLHHGLEDLALHRAHQSHLDLLQPGVPAQMELRILRLQLFELGQQQPRIHAHRGLDAVDHHRLQNRRGAGRLDAEPLAVLRL